MPTYSHQCEYCGAGGIPTTYHPVWTNKWNELPPPSAADPRRSDYMLTVFYIEAVMPGVGTNTSSFFRGIGSAYYDFKHKKWFNDLFSSRYREVQITHWMPQPPEDCPLWLSTEEFGIPHADPDEKNDWSISVLIHIDGYSYERAICSAVLTLKEHFWLPSGQFVQIEEIKAARWMMIPALLHPL